MLSSDVLYYENFNLTDVVTPVNATRLINDLKLAKYDPDEIEFLCNGFVNGFDIQYNGPKLRQSTSENILFTVGNKTELWNKVMKEVKYDRVAGPFNQVPFQNFIQSPIGLVPKAGSDQTRSIFHLSYDCK